MATPIKELSSFDLFFFYDDVSVALQNESEITQLLLQPQKSLFYMRFFGAGIHESENFPNTLSMLIGLRYDIVNAMSIRNTQVVDGTDGQKDRRMALSQETIKVEQKRETAGKGEIDISVLYVNLATFNQVEGITLPIGSTR